MGHRGRYGRHDHTTRPRGARRRGRRPARRLRPGTAQAQPLTGTPTPPAFRYTTPMPPGVASPALGRDALRPAELLRRRAGRAEHGCDLRQPDLPAGGAGLSARHPRGEPGLQPPGHPQLRPRQHHHPDLGTAGGQPDGRAHRQRQHALHLVLDRPARRAAGHRGAAARARHHQRHVLFLGRRSRPDRRGSRARRQVPAAAARLPRPGAAGLHRRSARRPSATS